MKTIWYVASTRRGTPRTRLAPTHHRPLTQLFQETMSAPPKHRRIGSFWKYYSGTTPTPVPTLFIGGNHEGASRK